jgi:hypothetical protein
VDNTDNSGSPVLNYHGPARSRPGPTAWDIIGGTIASLIALAAFVVAGALLISRSADFYVMFVICILVGLVAVRSAKARFRGLSEEVLPAYPVPLTVQVHRSKFAKNAAKLSLILGGVLLSAAVVFLLSLLFRKDWDVMLDLAYWLMVTILATTAVGLFRTASRQGERDRLNF